MNRFHKTTITVTVLSEDFYEPETLAQVADDIIYGGCSGAWEVIHHEEVSGKVMAKLLQEQGSEPSFFMLTSQGRRVRD